MIAWTPDQVSLREGLARWNEALSDGHIKDDAEATFPRAKWELIRDTGILSLPFDEKWGGLGQDLLTTMYVLEGLGEGCRDGGLNFAVSTSIVSTGVPLQRFGSPALQERFLPRICTGEVIGAHAITEPRGGSDALRMLTRATADGDHFVLNGSKAFVSNGPIADVFVIYARTHPDGGPLGISAFLVERGTAGFEVGPADATMGLKTSPLCELYFDDCRVPRSQVVGNIGGGFLILDHVMKWEILCSFIINVGEMAHRLARCLDYAKTRTQFGRTIGSYQQVANKIVDMQIRVDTARKWLYDTATRFSAGENITVDLAVSKLLTSEGNVASALAAVQIFGGYGYMADYGLEKDLRDAVASTIYSGTSEIQYNRIASMLGLGREAS